MRPRPLPVRVAALAVLFGVALSGCSDDDPARPQAAPSSAAAAPSTAPSTAPSPSASAARSGPDRSPAALAALLEFTAPAFDDPAVQEAVDGYEEYLRQFVVAQGLAQPDYPPMLAALDPDFADAALDNTRQAAGDGFFYAGRYVERVVDAVATAGRVVIASCADLSGRDAYLVETGELALNSTAILTPVSVTMTRGTGQWVLSEYDRNDRLACP